ncbi:diflavin flavoprotein [Nodularia spumigena CS-584]|jgi:flavorubredoxin/flavin reductase (DIM6/NTAB) family NADH-FMN oxidoreductase RutF|uniref:Flavin oxidoreductase n=4 Tax=Nodularia spumigena TaxID=70799 RepID=A0A161VPQ1_NODSP|nr:diflavin flavoprotein [Nodularia spumigena]AHJ27291.1 NAD(P)H-quinone oxidoreductase chain 5 [Nodularia spumigena CCY9414]KZL48965.1 flavin oxidoreductase [Nodularia spumigena CENA596]MDB9382499.1 diflavin flavoprotein [Nodularia spumigena CS-584]MEA5526171.1 diflavin flavoprotein [Nodularia spumigena UHCC 0143]MEA5557475.1 diflavin flavoprotein [Nodularia spumigena CH309]
MSINKPRDVQVLPIATDTTVMRSRSWSRLRFEIEYALAKGTTANSYKIQGDKIALIDPPGETFSQIYKEALQQRMDVTTIDYVILGHINPNRAATLKALLELAPQITFVCSNPGAKNLRDILENQDLPIIVMRGEETLNLGKGHDLQFIPTPNPRYADQLCTYDPQTEILYSDKLFGAHICGDQVFDEGWETINEDRRYYFDCLMAPHARQVETALDKLADLPIRMYATGHGPIVRYGLIELTKAYRQWIQQQAAADLTVALIYASAYGNTATLAQAIARGITKAGVGVESINCEFTEPEEIRAAVEKSAGFVIGSPTLGGHAPTPVQTALGIVLSTATNNQLAGVFGSFGWSGEAVDLIESKLKDAGYRFGFDAIRVKFKPDDVTLQLCEEAGTDFAQALKKAKKVRVPSQPATNVEQAVGRIVGSLSVVTAKEGDISSAMLASWVSQASFNPPGLTIAVAKDRALETLMHSGNKFVLNILPEGKHIGLMKHFLKPFAPGQDRFGDVATEESESGSPILTDALAYLECSVKGRLESGDHWLVYATVDNGKVLNKDGVTAVHQRKTGSHY